MKRTAAAVEYWHRMTDELIKFRREHGHCRIPSSSEEENPELHKWVQKMRIKHSDGVLEPAKDAELEILGFEWEPVPERRKRHRDDNQVDSDAGTNDANSNAVLEWKKTLLLDVLLPFAEEQQRQYHRRASGEPTTLTDERIRLLYGLGFDFHGMGAVPNEVRFEQLARYRHQHGHYDLPPNYGPNRALAVWYRRIQKDHQRCDNQELGTDGRADLLRRGPLNPSTETQINWNAGKEVNEAWQKMYQKLCQYKAEQDDCLVPRKYDDDVPLGNFVHEQREEYAKWRRGEESLLFEKRIQLLHDLGFVWDLPRTKGDTEQQFPDEDSWDTLFEELRIYKSEHSNCDVDWIRATNKKLGNWLCAQQVMYDNCREGGDLELSELTKERELKLEEIGFNFSKKDKSKKSTNPVAWDDRLEEYRQYRKRHGNAPIDRKGPLKTLALWVNNQRVNYKKMLQGQPTCMTQEKALALEKLGFKWEIICPWTDRFKELQRYREQHGDAPIPRRGPYKSLALWCNTQRIQRKRMIQGNATTMTLKHVEALDNLGFAWEVYGGRVAWNDRVEQLRQFIREHGHSYIPRKGSTCGRNKVLANFTMKMRRDYKLLKEGKHSSMTAERIRKLEEIGFTFETKPPPRKKVKRDNKNRQEVLPLTDPETDSDTGEENDYTWEDMYEELCHYKAEHGHCLVPRKYTNKSPIGKFVHQQRKEYQKKMKKKKSLLSEKQIRLLEDLGFVWNLPACSESSKENKSSDDSWNACFEELKQHKAKHPCQDVHQIHSANKKLCDWINAQQVMYDDWEKGQGEQEMLESVEERIRKLEKLGFHFSKKDENIKPAALTSEGRHKECRQTKKMFQGQTTCMRAEKASAFKKLGSQREIAGAWTDRLQQLRRYHKKFAEAPIPRKGPLRPLALWCNTQRKQYKKMVQGKATTMTKDRVAALENLGFSWGDEWGRMGWNDRLEELKQFIEEHGHSYFQPEGCLYAANKVLAKFANKMRDDYHLLHDGQPSAMTPVRIRKLEEIGFSWELKPL